jgi:hypothetical protein
VSVNGTPVEAKSNAFPLESTHFVFYLCPICTHDGASAKFSPNSQETAYSVGLLKSLKILAQATGPECSRTMGLMHLGRGEAMQGHPLHRTEVVPTLYMVICCTKDSSSGPFTVEDRGHALRGNALYKTMERQDYSRQRTECSMQNQFIGRRTGIQAYYILTVHRLEERQYSRAARLRRTEEMLYSRGACCSGQMRSSTKGLLVYEGQRRCSTARVLAAQDRGKAVQQGCSLTQDKGEAVKQE